MKSFNEKEMKEVKLCVECRAEHTNEGSYCNLCKDHMKPEGDKPSKKEDSMKEVKLLQAWEVEKDVKERKHLLWKATVEELYGADAVSNPETMCNDRYTGNIAHEATMCGRNIEEVLTRAETEDLARDDREYEACPHDLIDHGASEAAAFTRGQIKNFMSGREELNLSEEVKDVLNEKREYKSFISKEQKALNLEFYTRLLDECETSRDVAKLGCMLFGAVKASERTFTVLENNEEKEITAPTFFPAGTYSKFWADYKSLKEGLINKEQDKLVLSYNKVVNIINKALKETPKDNQKDVISYELSLVESQELWNAVKYAKKSGKTIPREYFVLIISNAKANKAA